MDIATEVTGSRHRSEAHMRSELSNMDARAENDVMLQNLPPVRLIVTSSSAYFDTTMTLKLSGCFDYAGWYSRDVPTHVAHKDKTRCRKDDR